MQTVLIKLNESQNDVRQTFSEKEWIQKEWKVEADDR